MRNLWGIVRQRWLILLVFFLLLLGWIVRVSTSSLEVRDQVGEATVYFGVSDPILLTTNDCYTLHWQVSGIQEIYLNDKGQIGQGEKELCYDDGLPPRLTVIFEDHTEKTYEIDVELIIDLPQFWLVVIFASIILQSILLVDASMVVKGTRRLSRIAPKRLRVWAIYCVISIIYIGFAFTFMPPLDIIEHSDSRYYLELAQNIGVISILDWDATRPPITPIIYSLFDEHVGMIPIIQLSAQVISWLLFAWTTANLMKTQLLRLLTALVILGFSLSVTVFHWWNVLLTESLTLSITVLVITVTVWFVRYLGNQPRPAWQQIILGADLLILVGIWLFLRDINFYAVIVLNGIALAFVLFNRMLRQRLPIFLMLVMISSLILAFIQNQRSIETERWKFPLTNVIVQRILPDELARNFFAANGLPISDKLLTAADAVDVYVELDSLDAFEDWLDTQGRQVYISYLLSQPFTTIIEPFNQRDAILLIHDDLRGYSQIQDVHPIQAVLTNLLAIHGSHLYGLSFGVAIFATVIAFRYGIDWRWLLPLVLLCMVYPLGFIVWHGDSIEVERHSLKVAILWRLGFWSLALISLDTFMVKRRLRLHNLDIPV